MKKTTFLLAVFLVVSCITYSQTYKLYGMTQQGGRYSGGNIFEYNITTNICTNVFSFNRGSDGLDPAGVGLCMPKNGLLYGMTSGGGTYNDGVLFSYDLNTNLDSTLVNCNSATGYWPSANCLIQASDGYLYGMMPNGGDWGNGLIFRYNCGKKLDTVVYSFYGDLTPDADLIQAFDGKLYGLTIGGGKYGYGAIFSFDPKTFVETSFPSFNIADGANPNGNNLIQATDSLLYGMAPGGGKYNKGVLYSFDLKKDTQNVLISFDSANGWYPNGSVIQGSDSLLYGMTGQGGSKNEGVIFSYNITTKKDSIIHNFSKPNGAYPLGTLVQNPGNGFLYGITSDGILFSIDPKTNNYTVLVAGFSAPGFGKLLLVADSTPLAANPLTSTKENISVYPNPARTVVHLVFQHSDEYHIEVDDLSGRKLKDVECVGVQCEINIESLAAGIYFIKTSDSNMNYISTSKLIIQ